MSEKHLPYIGGNFDRIVFKGDGSTWVREQSGTRYSELFGTPERAARTLEKLIEDSPFLVEESRDSFRPASICDLLNELCNGCGKCPSLAAVCKTEYSIEFECNGGDYDALLEWLRGDA